MLLSARALFLLSVVLAPIAVRAEGEAPPEALHAPAGTDIIVTAPFARERFTLPTAAGVLEGEALVRDTRASLGETLARQPGVSASWFGPAASRPILRGFDGERVRILTDGIGSFDVSNTSADHAVAINPLTAARVEVVRGPASLLYGSAAIGGVVNVTDRRIPREVPAEAVHLDLSGFAGSAAREGGLGGHADIPVGKTGLVLHADGNWSKSGDYRTGGYIYSADVRNAGDTETLARGRVANSGAESQDVAVGAAFIGAGGSIGLALSRLESRYGIPNRLAHGEENVAIDMRRTRLDARAELPLSGAFEALNFRFGWADYQHDEVESTGAVGTSFFSEGLESRLELVQAERNGWRGASGVQFLSRRIEAVGEEAYIPLNLTDQLGLFTLQQFDLGLVRAELGGRYEHSAVQALGKTRDFSAISASAGLSVALFDGFRLGLSLARTERAPAAEELFADGAHLATGSHETGNPDLVPERSLGAEAVLRGRGTGWRMEIAGFFSRFDNFIYQAPTGAEIDGLAAFEYRQAGARHWGMEAEGAATVARLGRTSIELTGLADFVRADLLAGRGHAPRIPPLRAIAGVEANAPHLGGRLELEHVTRQTRVAVNESETPAYSMVNASLSWRPFGEGSNSSIIASVNNMFDVEARRHASFLKDYAPLPGRDFRLAARFAF